MYTRLLIFFSYLIVCHGAGNETEPPQGLGSEVSDLATDCPGMGSGFMAGTSCYFRKTSPNWAGCAAACKTGDKRATFAHMYPKDQMDIVLNTTLASVSNVLVSAIIESSSEVYWVSYDVTGTTMMATTMMNRFERRSPFWDLMIPADTTQFKYGMMYKVNATNFGLMFVNSTHTGVECLCELSAPGHQYKVVKVGKQMVASSALVPITINGENAIGNYVWDEHECAYMCTVKTMNNNGTSCMAFNLHHTSPTSKQCQLLSIKYDDAARVSMAQLNDTASYDYYERIN